MTNTVNQISDRILHAIADTSERIGDALEGTPKRIGESSGQVGDALGAFEKSRGSRGVSLGGVLRGTGQVFDALFNVVTVGKELGKDLRSGDRSFRGTTEAFLKSMIQISTASAGTALGTAAITAAGAAGALPILGGVAIGAGVSYLAGKLF